MSAEGGAGTGGSPGESLSIMYSTLLRNYEAAKEDNSHLRRNCDELVASHAASLSKMEQMQDEISRYKKLYHDMLTERNQFNQQCTQAIRQWDQALRERNDYKDALVKVRIYISFYILVSDRADVRVYVNLKELQCCSRSVSI